MASFVKATLAGAVAYFVVGVVVFEGLLGNLTARHTTALSGFKKEGGLEGVLWIALSCVAYAALLSLVLVRWVGERRVRAGFSKGATIGALVACMTDFYWYGTSHFYNDFLPVAADIAAAAGTVGFMGAVVVRTGRTRLPPSPTGTGA